LQPVIALRCEKLAEPMAAAISGIDLNGALDAAVRAALQDACTKAWCCASAIGD
jgi:hypothetical protein